MRFKIKQPTFYINDGNGHWMAFVGNENCTSDPDREKRLLAAIEAARVEFLRVFGPI